MAADQGVAVQRIEQHAIDTAYDVVHARQAVRKAAVELGFSLIEQTKLVTAASELARNTFEHGGGGTMTLEVIDKGGRRGLRMVFEDRGNGIPDITLALKDGYTTGDGLGLGLGGAKRLLGNLEVVSKVGEGTRVTAVRWK
ncbi:MAG: ATP-binding protein [Trueperaceae bacterium]